MKTLVTISDTHCGSVFGLTPPKYWQKGKTTHYNLQKESWNEYRKILHAWKNPDVLLCNGDLIEGRQSIQGGAELTTSDRNVQVMMARECIEPWNAKRILMCYGSKYHVGDQAEDFEFNISDAFKAKIGGKLFFEIEGIVFDVRHKVNPSMVYNSRATSILREYQWNLLRAALDQEPKADVIIRSHVHYHIWVEQPGRVAFTTPALQLSRGRHGSRECTGETHWGAIRLTLDRGSIIGRDIWISKLRGNRPSIFKIK